MTRATITLTEALDFVDAQEALVRERLRAMPTELSISTATREKLAAFIEGELAPLHAEFNVVRRRLTATAGRQFQE